MSKDFETHGLLPNLLNWVAKMAGGEITACERIPGGASRLSYRLRTTSADKPEVFLRVDSGSGPLSGTVFTLEREVSAMRALKETAVRLPKIYGYNTEHRAVLMETVGGTSDFFSVTDQDRARALQDDLLKQLALLHQSSVDLHAAFGADTPASIKDALRTEIRLWSDLYATHVPEAEPIISFALDWLLHSAPGGDQPPVLVHGDIGPGNFLFEGASVGALIDWEITHPGHPLEDIACIIARTLGVPFGDLRQHVATYGRLTGSMVDYTELDYCVVLVLTRFCIGISMGIAKASLAVDIPILVKFLQVNLFALVRIMARFAGIPEDTTPPVEAPPTSTSTRPLYDFMTDVLTSQIKPAVEDRFLLARLDGVTGLATYLRNLADYGTDKLRAEELAALTKVLRRNVGTVQEGRKALPAALAQASDGIRAEILRWLLRRSAREHLLMKDMLGPMYDRTLVY